MKNKKYLSFIIVKDENKEPVNIKISYRLLYFLLTVVFTVVLGVALAMIYYYRFYNLYSNYNEILAENLLLKEERSKVTEIFLEFRKIREIDKRLRNLLGDNSDLSTDLSTTEIEELSSLDNSEDAGSDISSISSIYDELRVVKIDNVNNIPSLFPVEDGYITQGFEKVAHSELLGHPGIDIVSKEGSVIKATADGVIVFSGWSYKDGYVVIIDHQNGFFSFYKHNKRLLEKEGRSVKKGTSIALLGNSGLSSGPHLHFEVWKDGVPVDPTLLVGK